MNLGQGVTMERCAWCRKASGCSCADDFATAFDWRAADAVELLLHEVNESADEERARRDAFNAAHPETRPSRIP